MKKLSNDLQLLTELQCDQIDIVKIKEQRHIVHKIQQSLLKKDEQISKIKSLLQKYQHYQQKYASLKIELHQKNQLINHKESQCKLFQQQLKQIMHEHQLLQEKLKNNNQEKASLLKQRHSLQITNKQIESTFKEYKNQCRKRENSIVYDLERAHQQIKELNANIDQLEIKIANSQHYQSKVHQLQLKLHNTTLILAQKQTIKATPQKKQDLRPRPITTQKNKLLQQISYLKQTLLLKQQELTSNRVLNYQLTIQYDQSINNICTLQSELSSYRRQNNQLKKIISLLRQKQRCQQIQMKYSYKSSGIKTKYVTPQSDISVNSQPEQDVQNQKGQYQNDRRLVPTFL